MDANLRIGIDNRGAVAPARVITSSLADVKRSALGAVGAIAALAGIGSTLAIVRKAVDTYRMLETALIGVGKTSNMAGKDLAQFGLDVQNLARRLPVAQQELLNIAEVAAQLGVDGQENLLKFADTVARLGRTSNLQGEAAATALARVLNVTKEGMGSVDRLASVIVRLGNSSAATESEIADMATEIAKATSLFGFSAAEAAGYSAALKDIGAEAELSSTTIFSSLSILDSISRKGAEGMHVLEQITGMSGETFRKAFKENAADALTIFLEGLNRLKSEGEDVSVWMQQFGLDGVRAGKVLPPLAANVDKLRQYLADARGEWQQNSAMTKEFGAFAKSTDSQLQLLSNEVQIFFQEVGRGANEGLRDLIAALREIMADSSGAAKALGQGIGNALTLMANLLRLVADNATAVKVFLVFLAAYKAHGLLSSIESLRDMIRLMNLYGVAGAKLIQQNVGASIAEGFTKAGTAVSALASPLGVVAGILLAIAGAITVITADLNTSHEAMLKQISRTQEWAGEVTRLRGLLNQSGPGTVVGADVASAKADLQEMKNLASQLQAEISAADNVIKSSSAFSNWKSGRSADNVERKAELEALNGKIAAQAGLIGQLETAYDSMGGAAGEALRNRVIPPVEDATTRNLELEESVKQLTMQLKAEAMSLDATGTILKRNKGNWDAAEASIAAVNTVIANGIDPTTAAGKHLVALALANEKVRVSFDRSKSSFNERKAAVEELKRAEDAAAESRLQRMRDLQRERIAALRDVRDAGVDAAQELEDAQRLNVARREGAEALRLVNVELEIARRLRALDPKGLVDRQSDAWKRTAEEIRKSVEEQSKLTDNSTKTSRAWEKAAGWLGVISQISGTIGGKFANLVNQAGQFADAMMKAAEAQKAGDKMGAAMAGVQAGQAIFSLGQQYAGWKGQRGKGTFGAQMSGDYSDMGAMIGGMIGAGFGGPVGAAIGSVLGGLLGSAIKTGAEQGLATLKMNGDKIVLSVLGNGQGGLGTIIGDMAVKMLSGFQDIVNTLGGQVASIPEVDMEIADDIITVIVDGYKRKFDDIDQAIQYGIQELLKSSEITGVDQMLLDIMRASIGGGMEELQKNLEAGVKVMEFGMTDSQKAILAFTGELDGLSRRMINLLGPTDQLARALQNIGQEEIRRWQSERDRITGDKQSNAEKLAMLKADGTMWNAEKALRIAELTLRRDKLAADIKLVEAGGTLNTQETIAQANYLQTKADLYGYELQLGAQHLSGLQKLDEAALAQLKILFDSINLVITALSNMPDIDVPNLHLPGGAGNVAAGPSKADQRKDFLAEVDAIARGGLPNAVQGVLELSDRLAELSRRAAELGVSEERLAAARQVLIDQQKKNILNPIQQYLDPSQGGTRGMSDWQQSAGEIAAAFDEARAANQALIDETGERAIAFWRLNEAEINALHDLALDAIDSLGLPLENTRDEIARWQETLDFLKSSLESGALSAEEYGNVIAEVAQQAEVGFLSLAQNILEQMGNTQMAEEVKRQLEEANFLMQIAQLNLLYDALLALGDVGDVLRERLAPILGWINDPENWPDFDRPARPGAGAGNANAADEIASLRESVLERIERWSDLKLSPAERQLKALNKEFAQLEADARRAGVSMDLVREAFNAALEDFWNGLLTPLRDFLDDLALSDLSTLTPQQRLGEAQTRFDELAARARAGDLEAMQLLPGAAQALLDEARSFFAGSEGFAAILANVQSVIEQILGQHGLSVPANPNASGSGNPLLTPGGTVRDVPFGTGGNATSPTAGSSSSDQRLDRIAREQEAARLQAQRDAEALREEVAETNRRLQALSDDIRRGRGAATDDRRDSWGAA